MGLAEYTILAKAHSLVPPPRGMLFISPVARWPLGCRAFFRFSMGALPKHALFDGVALSAVIWRLQAYLLRWQQHNMAE